MPWNKPLPEWNKSAPKPAQFKLDEGWLVEEKPPASIFNWFQYTAYHAIKELQDNGYTKSEADSMAQNTVEAYAEPIITKNTAFNKDFGTSPGTVAEGDVVPRVTAIEDDWSLKERQTANPTHGVSVLNSDIPSSLKVEFYGNTLVNLLGGLGRFKDSDGDGIADGGSIYGSSSLYRMNGNSQELNSTVTASAYSSRIGYDVDLKSGKYYIALVDFKNVSNGGGRLYFGAEPSTYFTSDGLKLVKFNPTTDGSYSVYLYNTVNDVSESWVGYSKLRVYEVGSDTYNEIGVSYSDADVERLFPYVDSVQHVENPVLSVEGENLLDGQFAFDDDDSVTSNGEYNANISFDSAINPKLVENLKVAENTDLTFHYEKTINSGSDVGFSIKDENGNELSGSTNKTVSFNTGTAKEITIEAWRSDTSGDVDISNWMLNLGTTAKPFVPRNPSYLYAETTLAGNENKKDILRQSDGTWYKEKWWEHVALNGDLSYSLSNGNFSGFKRISFVDFFEGNGNPVKINASKPDGSILKNKYDVNEVDVIRSGGSNDQHLFLFVSNSESGWTEDINPNENEMYAFLNGWIATSNDGTNYTEWESYYDSSVTTTDINEALDRNLHEENNNENYFLSYQLAESQTINVDHLVEGSLSIEGDAQISVGEGVIVREEVTLIQGTDNNWYGNSKSSGYEESLLKHEVDHYIELYKNGKEFNPDEIYSDNKFMIKDDNYNGETITVTYEILDKYDFTTNNNDVTVHYNTSHGSSFQEEVTRTTDIATEVTIQKGQLNRHEANYVDHPAFAVSSGTSTAYTATLNPAPSAYKDGMEIKLAIHTDATGASTLNINELGAIPLKKSNGNSVDNLKANGVYKFVYYNGNFILQGEGGEGTAQPADVLSGETFTNDDGVQTGSMTNQGAYNITPTTTNQAIPQGYHDGQGIVEGDPDLISANIRNGVSLFGVAGKNTVIDTERKTGIAYAADVLEGNNIFVDGQEIAGTMDNRGNGQYSATWENPDDSTQVTVNVPGDGYYNTGSNLYISDAQLTPSNIRDGVDVFGVVGTLVEGKRTATGTAQGYEVDNVGYIDVENIGFTPSIIIAQADDSTYNHLTVYVVPPFYDTSEYLEVKFYDGANWEVESTDVNTSPSSPSSSSMTLKVDNSNYSYSWIAYE